MMAFEDDPTAPLLVLEDLSHATWPPPWSSDRIERVLATLQEVARATPPPATPTVEEVLGSELHGWSLVAAEPHWFLSLGLASQAWFERALPDLLQAGATGAPEASGDQLLHMDVRSDNLCFDGDRTLLIDWNWACLGNPKLDVAAWLPSLHAEGGPRPDEILPDEPGLAAVMSGFFAFNAGRPVAEASPRVRTLQLEQLRTALPWTVRALGLAEPEPVESGSGRSS